MKVLDATYLVDYRDGVEATKEFYEANGVENEGWMDPVPGTSKYSSERGTSRTVTSTTLEPTSRGARHTQSTRGRQ